MAIIKDWMQTITWSYAFKCNICGHVWGSAHFTAKSPPNNCAKCKSPRWNEDVAEYEKKQQINKKNILAYLRYYKSLYVPDGNPMSQKEYNFIVQMIEDVRSQRLEKR